MAVRSLPGVRHLVMDLVRADVDITRLDLPRMAHLLHKADVYCSVQEILCCEISYGEELYLNAKETLLESEISNEVRRMFRDDRTWTVLFVRDPRTHTVRLHKLGDSDHYIGLDGRDDV